MTTPLLEARGVRRQFGHVQALDGADFAVMPGEICALIGDNGAGKSTLVKILSGAVVPDEGADLPRHHSEVSTIQSLDVPELAAHAARLE